MMRWLPLVVVSLFLISLCIPSPLTVAADDEAKEEAARRLTAMKKIIEGVDLAIGQRGADKLVRVDEPIQRWSNPVIPIRDATVFLWTHEGRPAAVAQVADVPDKGLWQEFQSLTTEPIQGQAGGRKWSPRTPELKWLRAHATEAPAKTSELRRVQMRKIAEKYQVSDVFEFKDPNQLRLLPTPLYRYAVPKSGVLDGALFSYALGTDPEVLLLIESQKVEEVDTWMVAFARLTGFACRATLDDKEVWSCKVLPWPTPTESTFFAIP
jgi:hypothetical protein